MAHRDLLEQGFGEARQVWCSASDALVAALCCPVIFFAVLQRDRWPPGPA
ncbi:hypothetical protein RJT17_33595 [Streptomyces sp. P5-A9]